MSRSAFAARFTQLVEEPPLTYVTRWRMQKASRLLETSHAAVAEVAKRVGYDAEAAFSKAFKRWIGAAPGAYRRTAESRESAGPTLNGRRSPGGPVTGMLTPPPDRSSVHSRRAGLAGKR
jgi:AraC-like DNA-binding protein